jgi:leucyl-tRNA synthetase
VVDPQELIDRYGADTVRMFCLFAAPPERDLEWSAKGVDGASRFLNRVWHLVAEHLDDICGAQPYRGDNPVLSPLASLHRKTHQTIKKVTSDIENNFHFNTAIAAVMELVNETNQLIHGKVPRDDIFWSVIREAVEAALVLLYPIVPHITEELWHMLGHEKSLLFVRWPSFRQDALIAEKILVVLQVNGKVRSRIELSAESGKEEIEKAALSDERIQRFIGGKQVKKVIVVQNKLVNIVT